MKTLIIILTLLIACPAVAETWKEKELREAREIQLKILQSKERESNRQDHQVRQTPKGCMDACNRENGECMGGCSGNDNNCINNCSQAFMRCYPRCEQ